MRKHAGHPGTDAHSPDRWALQEARARLGELIRRAQNVGPQRVTLRGGDEVVVVTAAEFRRLTGELTGAALIAALRDFSGPELEIAPARDPLPVRDVVL